MLAPTSVELGGESVLRHHPADMPSPQGQLPSLERPRRLGYRKGAGPIAPLDRERASESQHARNKGCRGKRQPASLLPPSFGSEGLRHFEAKWIQTRALRIQWDTCLNATSWRECGKG